MRIHALELTNITSYEHTVMTFPERLTVIVGHNGDGKTTVADAIRQGLTGECARTERGGGKQERMVRTGAQQGSIGLSVCSNGAEPLAVTRFVPGELLIEGQRGNKTQLQANLCDNLGIELPVLSAALSTSALLEMKSAELKGMFFGLLGLSFDQDDIAARIGFELGVNPKDIGRLLTGAPVSCWTGDSKTFDNLYKHFYDLRRDVNRDIKNLGELPPQMQLVSDLPDKAEVVEQLQALHKQRDGLLEMKSKAMMQEGERKKLERDIAEWAARLEGAGDPEAAKAELDRDLLTMQELENELSACRKEAEAYEDAATKLAESTACPLAPELITCGMAKTKREKLVSELRTKLEMAEKSAHDANRALEPLRKAIPGLREAADKPSKSALDEQISQACAELKQLGEPLPDTAEYEAEITDLAGRIAKGEKLLADINRSEGATEARAAQVEKRAKLEAQAEVLDALVKVLKVLPGKILDESIGPIQNQANARLSALTGGRYQLHIEVDPDFAIIVDHDGVSSPLGLLSSSEQQRVGIILQDAIVRLSGLRFLIVDEADKLDPENRALLTEYLLDISDEYQQIIVLATIGTDGVHKPDPPIEGLALYELTGGQLREVE
jgi:DNA repair exonuclease SbcCD ATPase subunit